MIYPTSNLTLFKLCASAVLIASLVACGGGEGNEANESGDDAYTPTTGLVSTPTDAIRNQGADLHAKNCASCHGGGQPRSAKNAQRTLDAIARNKGGMGYLAPTIKAAESDAIAAYIAYGAVPIAVVVPTPTVVPASTPAVATPTTASAANGKVIYTANCAICHTANPSANVSKVLKGANSAITIQNAIINNVGGMGVLSSTIGASQAADLAVYLAAP